MDNRFYDDTDTVIWRDEDWENQTCTIKGISVKSFTQRLLPGTQIQLNKVERTDAFNLLRVHHSEPWVASVRGY